MMAIGSVQEQQDAAAAAAAEAKKSGQPFPLSLFANATAEDYIDDADCAACHAEPHAAFQPSPHRPYVSNPNVPRDKQGCQSCHGPGGPHIAHLEEEGEIRKYIIDYDQVNARQGALACMRCHNDTMTQTHWQRTAHARNDVSCADCHSIHQDGHGDKPGKENRQRSASAARKNPVAPVFAAKVPPQKLLKSDEATLCGSCHQREVNEFRHNFHHPVPEGRQVCSDCHQVHERRESAKQDADSRTAAQARNARIRSEKEMCASCHAETVGPFVFEHDPVQGHTGDGCLDCHRAHGSHNPRLLNNFSRGLCNQCHSDKGSSHFPGRTCWQSGCHVAVHGSNTDRLLLRK